MNLPLLELAKLYGIQTSYIDMTKQRREADPQSLLLVLKAMGAGLDRMDDVPKALRRRKEELKQRKVEPVVVAWDGKVGRQQFEFGYHEIEMKGCPVFVISAPRQAYFPHTGRRPKLWGMFAPVYALHSRRNPGAGDLTDFGNLMEWMYELGGSVASTLPLLGALLDEPFEPGPYSPATRLFWNEFYIDVERIPEFAGRPRVKPPKKQKFVDYRGIMAHKRRILEELSELFFSDATPERLLAYGKFLRENPGVEDYAKFRAVTDRQRKSWQHWPTRLRNGTVRTGDYDDATKNYHLYAQFAIQEQLRSLAVRADAHGQFLYLDLPLGINTAGYDIWRNRDLFVEGVSGGSPPDPVFTKGQNWGFAPMNPEAMRLNRYKYVIAYLRNHFRYSKLLRIDHVMGLHRLYWIPNELSGDKGVYVEYPADELWAILSLESHRHKAGIVGENLGTVPPEVNESMSQHDIRQMYVVQYEIMDNPAKPRLRRPPEKCVASVNTHDMPPFQAFLKGTDIDDRVDLGFIDEKMARTERQQRKLMRRAMSPSYKGILEFLSNSVANIVLVNLEDLWKETLPQNVPATSQERPNWRRLVRPSVEQIRKMTAVAEVLSHVFAQRSRPLPV